ncbi:MAG: hypothetical protein AUH85_06605 [Chloroflexi bacterium 13_1_40CM_4_68_4]|nr:MAG: hypothetical protein AUH85_06605 [Chloroflexi bacterium 13_1_40CM_4_68_4]
MAHGRAFIGTSGFGYATWIPRFYPEGTKSKDFLKMYATKLSSVESNFTFNQLPTEKALASWVAATPEPFRFALKASRRITHLTLLRDTAESLPRFLERVHGLGSRLGCVLFQTPPWLKRDDQLLLSFLQALPPSAPRAAFEFRNDTWYDDAVYAILRERNVALCTAEGERAPAPFNVTADFVYLRLRNKEQPYTTDTLASWRDRLRAVLEDGKDVYAYLYHDELGENALMTMWLAQQLS